MGLHKLTKTVEQLLKDANLNGYITNGRLRRGGITRYFQNMIDRKFLKEFTGHASDLINQYNIISEKQCEALNKII